MKSRDCCPHLPTVVLPGLSGSLPVLVLVEPNITSSTAGLNSVRELQLLPLFDRYTFEATQSVPTRDG